MQIEEPAINRGAHFIVQSVTRNDRRQFYTVVDESIWLKEFFDDKSVLSSN